MTGSYRLKDMRRQDGNVLILLDKLTKQNVEDILWPYLTTED